MKLMADYGCWPLWCDHGNETKTALHAWAEAYNTTLNRDYPPDSCFPDPQSQRAFETKGVRLIGRLRSELGSNVCVLLTLPPA